MNKQTRQATIDEAVAEMAALCDFSTAPANADEVEILEQQGMDGIRTFRAAKIAIRASILSSVSSDCRPPFVVLGEWAAIALDAHADSMVASMMENSGLGEMLAEALASLGGDNTKLN